MAILHPQECWLLERIMSPEYYRRRFEGWQEFVELCDLTGDNATLEITRGAHASGDIHASAASTVTIGSDTPAELASAETT
ncbi:hypothetical protein O5585_27670, partial [Escherichia coli]|nr:hypothetical protein [Escherichia coli]